MVRTIAVQNLSRTFVAPFFGDYIRLLITIKMYPIPLRSCFFGPIVKVHPSSRNLCSEFLANVPVFG